MGAFLPPLLRVVEEEGHRVFVNGLWNLNIIGIRSPVQAAGRFDDRLHLVYRDESGWVDRSFPITTDPGSHYFEPGKELNSKGIPFLQPGQYPKSHRIGPHKGYSALVQVGELFVKRAPVGSEATEAAAVIEDRGMFGINIHASDPNPYDTEDRERGADAKIYGWSAGCQVFANSSGFRVFMALCEKSSDLYGNRFTYTLLEE